MKKSIIFGGSILCLFILVSLSYQPIMAVEQIEYEKITVNVCGLDGLESQRLTLSKENGERIDVIFDDLRNKLSKVETRQEILIIYNDALEELDKLSIFGDNDLNKLKNIISYNLQLRCYSISGVTTQTNFIAPGYKLQNVLKQYNKKKVKIF